MIHGQKGPEFEPHREYDEHSTPIGRCMASSMTLMEAQKIRRDQPPDPKFANRKPGNTEIYGGMKPLNKHPSLRA